MRILYLTPFVPCDLRPKSANLLPRLAARHAVKLLCLGEGRGDAEKIQALTSYLENPVVVPHHKIRAVLQCARALLSTEPLRMAYFQSPRMRAAIQKAIAAFHPEIIYCEKWRMAQLIPPSCPVPVLCDPTDSMLLYNRRLRHGGRWWQRLVAAEEEIKFRSAEPRLARQVDASVFCSAIDLNAIREKAVGANLVVIANGVDTERFYRKQASEGTGNEILFTGSFTYPPNIRAAEWFLQNVWPRIQSAVAEVRFCAVGHLARKRLAPWCGREKIEILDYVPSLRPSIARAAVSVAPIQFGVGVTNKILEAFSVGTPVVATRMACGDLPVCHRQHLLLADAPEEFAAAVIELLKNRELGTGLANAARWLVEQKYEWTLIVQEYERLMAALIEQSGGRARDGQPAAGEEEPSFAAASTISPRGRARLALPGMRRGRIHETA